MLRSASKTCLRISWIPCIRISTSCQKEMYFRVYNIIFNPSFATLVDIFEALNMLNFKLQGPHTTITMHNDAIKVFIVKLGLWERKIEVGTISAFHCRTQIMGEEPLEEQLQKEIKTDMSILQKEFYCYFHRHNASENVQVTVLTLSTALWMTLQTLYRRTTCISSTILQHLRISDYWAKILPIFPKISGFTTKIFILFSSTHLCESGFLSLLVNKSKT